MSDETTHVAATAPPDLPFRRLVERLPAVLYVAEGARLVYISPHVEALLGHAPERWLSDPELWLESVHPDDRPQAPDPAGAPPAGRPLRSEYRMLDCHGGSVWVRDLRTTIDDDGVARTCGLLIEIPTPAHAAGDAALRDPTTLLAGAALLREHLALAVARARQRERHVAVLHVKVDGLDLVAGALGARARDAVAREVAGRVRGALPATEIVAAPAPGELAVMLGDLGDDSDQVAEAAAGQVLAAIHRPLTVDGREFDLAARIGISCYPGDANDDEALLRHAGAALAQAHETDDRLVHYAGATSDALEQLMLGARLRRALERDEFALHYQPIVRLADGAVVAVEALLRWRDPERGLIPPLEFIPAAEYTGLIEPIGRWVVGEMCEQAHAWRDAGVDVPVSFNVSLRQFRDDAFPAMVRDALAAHGLDPHRFIVEITESVAMRDPACVEPVLEELREIGLQVAIDDFGTGHSSLARLQTLPVDLLKIDRGFLEAAPDDERAGRLLTAALGLVDALDMRAVAEGVETESQRAFLADGGCALAQGFHLARPLPADEATALLRERRG